MGCGSENQTQQFQSGFLNNRGMELTVNYPINLFLTLGSNSNSSSTLEQRVWHTCGRAIYIKKCLKLKEELWKFKYFTMQKI